MGIEIEHDFAAEADQVWAIVGVPDRVDWVPGIEGCVYDGEVRRFNLPGAGQLAERIVQLDDEARFISYSVIESTPPLDAHLASIQVVATDAGCRMVWRTEVEPAAVEPFIEQSMQLALKQIHHILEGN